MELQNSRVFRSADKALWTLKTRFFGPPETPKGPFFIGPQELPRPQGGTRARARRARGARAPPNPPPRALAKFCEVPFWEFLILFVFSFLFLLFLVQGKVKGKGRKEKKKRKEFYVG